MSATPLAWYAHIIDLTTDTVVASTTDILDAAWGRKRNAAGTCRVGVRPGNAFCTAIVTAWGGPTYQGPIQQYLLEVSQDGGTTIDSAMWVEKGRVVLSGAELGAVLDGDDIFSGYDRSYIDHETFFGVPAGAILDAPAGQVPAGQQGLILQGPFLPGYRRGFFQQSTVRSSLPGAHRLHFSVSSDPFIAVQAVSTDVNSDSILRSAINVLQAASSTIDPAHPEQFGAHQSFAVDIANRVVHMGYRGSRPKLTLTGKKAPAACDETVEAAILEVQPTTIEPNLSAMFAQAEFIGGSSTHNMPDGGTFTRPLVINRNHGSDSVRWRDSLCVLGISTGNGGGGVYFWPHDGAMHSMSGLMDVRDLAYDATTTTLYAATSRGIYSQRVGYTATPWTRLGSLDLDCTKVWLPTSGVVYALANGPTNQSNAGSNGVYRFPQVAGEPATDAGGYGGWTYIHTNGTILDAAGTDAAFYYVDTEAPDTITLHRAGGDDPAPITTSRGEHITGLDYTPESGTIYVRTEAGAAGLYYLTVGTTQLLAVGAAATLADSFGPLAVNTLLATINGQTGTAPLAVNGVAVGSLVGTDRGIWWSAGTTAGPYQPVTGQSGLDSTNAVLIAAGNPQTVLGRVLVRLYATSGRSLYISNDGGQSWTDVISASLDGGAGWQALHKEITGDYADNDVAALGNLSTAAAGTPSIGSIMQFSRVQTAQPALIDIGGTGRVVSIPAGNPFALPVNWVLARRLTPRNEFSYRLLDTVSPAPYNAIKLNEAIEIQADDSRGVVTASLQVLIAAYRFLAQSNRAQLVLTVHTQYATQEAALRTALTGDQVLLDHTVAYLGSDGLTTTTLLDMRNQPMYIIAWDGQLQNGIWDVTVQVANSTAFAVLDVAQIVAGVANGQAKDRRLRGSRTR